MIQSYPYLLKIHFERLWKKEAYLQFDLFEVNYIWSFVVSDSIVLIGEVGRHFTSAPAVQCPIEELCQVWCVVWSNSTNSCCWMEYVNHTGKQFWNNLIVFLLGWEKLQMFCTIYGQLVWLVDVESPICPPTEPGDREIEAKVETNRWQNRRFGRWHISLYTSHFVFRVIIWADQCIF